MPPATSPPTTTRGATMPCSAPCHRTPTASSTSAVATDALTPHSNVSIPVGPSSASNASPRLPPAPARVGGPGPARRPRRPGEVRGTRAAVAEWHKMTRVGTVWASWWAGRGDGVAECDDLDRAAGCAGRASEAPSYRKCRTPHRRRGCRAGDRRRPARGLRPVQALAPPREDSPLFLSVPAADDVVEGGAGAAVGQRVRRSRGIPPAVRGGGPWGSVCKS
jgi:hypothetical protein